MDVQSHLERILKLNRLCRGPPEPFQVRGDAANAAPFISKYACRHKDRLARVRNNWLMREVDVGGPHHHLGRSTAARWGFLTDSRTPSYTDKINHFKFTHHASNYHARLMLKQSAVTNVADGRYDFRRSIMWISLDVSSLAAFLFM